MPATSSPRSASARREAYESAKGRVVSALHGRVLEIGAGEGANFDRLATGVRWLGLEPDRRRRARLEQVANRHGHPGPCLDGTAEDIALPDDSVDGVLSTIALCSVDDQHVALREIARVLRPGGLFVFAEHIAGPPGSWVRRAQVAVTPLSRWLDHGCDPSRDTETAIVACPLDLLDVTRHDLSVGVGVRVPYVVGMARG